MITIRRVIPSAVALALVIASCGGSSDGGTDDSEPTLTVAVTVADSVEDFTKVEGDENVEVDEVAEPTATDPDDSVAEDTVAEPATSAEPADEPAEADEPTDAADDPTVGDAATGDVDVGLSEWEIDAPTEYTAGEITFNATNDGNFPHEFVVIGGEGYESLPRAEGGAVLEDDLPTGALIGRTDRVASGSSETLTVTLGPGNYVLLCNLGNGANSHAGKGQRLDVTVI